VLASPLPQVLSGLQVVGGPHFCCFAIPGARSSLRDAQSFIAVARVGIGTNGSVTVDRRRLQLSQIACFEPPAVLQSMICRLPSTLHELLSRDHERLDALLAGALRDDGTIDAEMYTEFRRGLLRHIGIEERILFPEIRKRAGASEIVRQLHRDHAALAALLVPPPSRVEIELIRGILVHHNPLEEGPGGLYEHVEELAGNELESLMSTVRSFPEIPMAPYSDTPLLRRSIEQLLREAEDGRRLLRGR
jgi:hypothetical protein